MGKTWFSLFPVVLGILMMVVADVTNDVTLALFGLGTLLIGLTVMVLYKLNQILHAIRAAGEDVKTVLKQRLH
ncbi:MAG: hypothetical protein VF00_C0011G0009 [candidate division Kazan bacterium GW2011_GWB1_52_7]|uniref:Uncharacterized protein n=1 Tax=candidate division Kazan bacterium GW2011_GWB1_52_7 TaxID=1620414 RepID=A0A0G1X670_UNCK3|nr:MAG: hypothetical protein VF00_C0011G0009 [candidate division Kazan bacterium GW2011_GWB1_52_7]